MTATLKIFPRICLLPTVTIVCCEALIHQCPVTLASSIHRILESYSSWVSQCFIFVSLTRVAPYLVLASTAGVTPATLCLCITLKSLLCCTSLFSFIVLAQISQVLTFCSTHQVTLSFWKHLTALVEVNFTRVLQ